MDARNDADAELGGILRDKEGRQAKVAVLQPREPLRVHGVTTARSHDRSAVIWTMSLSKSCSRYGRTASGAAHASVVASPWRAIA